MPEEVTAPMPGKITRVDSKVGDQVDEGHAVMMMEAMKMEMPIVATKNGVIKEIKASAGDSVATGDVLFIIE